MAGDRVLLLHGIARRSGSLASLERAVAAAGYRTLNLDYPARRKPLEELVEDVHRMAGAFVGAQDGRVHFVTHSMGGLLARAYVARHRPAALGRVVMLAPPSQGSEVADLLARNRIYQRFFGPAGAQLGTCRDGRLRDLLGTVDYTLGVIAGDRSIYPLSWLLIPRANDGRVSVARTMVVGMADHIVVHATHPMMMRNRRVFDQTVHFLRHGRFARGV
ncbi:MAG: esterase/lipase family protein [Janthinobacterium lividum]